jgi:hypothetical protein
MSAFAILAPAVGLSLLMAMERLEARLLPGGDPAAPAPDTVEADSHRA